TPGSSPGHRCRAAAPWLLLPDTAPRSACSADNLTPSTPPLPSIASSAPLPSPSLPLGSALSSSIQFSPIAVPPRRRNSKGDTSNVVSRGHFQCGSTGESNRKRPRCRFRTPTAKFDLFHDGREHREEQYGNGSHVRSHT